MNFTPLTVHTAAGAARVTRVYTIAHHGRPGVTVHTTIGSLTIYGREVYGFGLGHIGTVSLATDCDLVRRRAISILGAALINADREAAELAAADAARPAFVLPDGVDFLDYLLTAVTR